MTTAGGDAGDEAEPQIEYSGLANVQYRGKGDFSNVWLSLTPSAELVFKEGNQAGKTLRSANVRGCLVAEPKSARKGHKHCLRLDVAESDTEGDKKYIISVDAAEGLVQLGQALGLYADQKKTRIQKKKTKDSNGAEQQQEVKRQKTPSAAEPDAEPEPENELDSEPIPEIEVEPEVESEVEPEAEAEAEAEPEPEPAPQRVDAMQPAPAPMQFSPSEMDLNMDARNVNTLRGLGFSAEQVTIALAATGGDLHAAAGVLLEEGVPPLQP